MSRQKNQDEERLLFLLKMAKKAAQQLKITSNRLFAEPLTLERVSSLDVNTAESEQVDAFVSRFARLQDILGAKLLPAYFRLMGEENATLLENLDKAEKLGIIESADAWMTMRHLRNQMVHEYLEDAEILQSALKAANNFTKELFGTLDKLIGNIIKVIGQHNKDKT